MTITRIWHKIFEVIINVQGYTGIFKCLYRKADHLGVPLPKRILKLTKSSQAYKQSLKRLQHREKLSLACNLKCNSKHANNLKMIKRDTSKKENKHIKLAERFIMMMLF